MQDIQVSVDVVLMTFDEDVLKIALLKRDKEPKMGVYALPGGFVHTDKDINARATIRRVIKEKLGLEDIYVEQLRSYSGILRDERKWSMSDCYYALVPFEKVSSCENVKFEALDNIGELPFDHNEMIRDAVSRLKNMSAYSSLPLHFFGEKFTIPRVMRIYELLKGGPINQRAFRLKMKEMGVVPLEEHETGSPNKNAQYHTICSDLKASVIKLDRGM